MDNKRQCKFFNKGSCKKGNNCDFWHGPLAPLQSRFFTEADKKTSISSFNDKEIQWENALLDLFIKSNKELENEYCCDNPHFEIKSLRKVNLHFICLVSLVARQLQMNLPKWYMEFGLSLFSTKTSQENLTLVVPGDYLEASKEIKLTPYGNFWRNSQTDTGRYSSSLTCLFLWLKVFRKDICLFLNRKWTTPV
jgi:hypothetical protein